jgi:charged multivesicular body protein 5
MEELIEQANEIQETLGRTYGVPDEVDEADLEAGTLLCCKWRPQFETYLTLSLYTELEALGEDFGEEEEIPSYLKDSNALPDFIDEAPVPAQTVGPLH